MSDTIEAFGAMATAGLAANALDGPGADHGTHGESCLNCGTALTGPFCGQCGQKGHVHRSLLHVGEEFLHGITHLDGKAWHTLPALVFRPGKLTREYIEGKRARYIAPVPLFLMVVFLMFFVLSFLGGSGGPIKPENISSMTPKQATQQLAALDKDLAAARAKLQALPKDAPDGDRAAINTKIGVLEAVRPPLAMRAEGRVDSPLELPELLGAALQSDEVKVDFVDPSLTAKAKHALKNPDLLFYKLQNKAYKLSFLLVPMSLPWLWLVLFWRRHPDGTRVGMYDHAIFALYSISFMSLLFVAVCVAGVAGMTQPGAWIALVVVAPLFHLFTQLRGAYKLRVFSAAWRTVFLANAAVITLSFYATLLLPLGLLD